MQADDAPSILNEALGGIRQARQEIHPKLTEREIGIIRTVGDEIVTASGLPRVGLNELVRFQDGSQGIAFNIDRTEIGIIRLDSGSQTFAGERVERTGRVTDVPVGEELIGKVIDPTGKSLTSEAKHKPTQRRPIERHAPSIMERAPVNAPLQTGIKVVDTLIPVGRGQRELIIGDRQTGKTSIALDAIVNQKGGDVICIYCTIGQRASAVASAVAALREKGAMEHTVVVVTEGNDPAGLKYIAPYAATTIGEFFMEKGRDVLIVYDDLTQHARAYRELSLLSRRPPGREAYPGDIFYIHARLLERATHLRPELGGGSLTALPIIETEEGNLADYISTNLISITDGQLYLSADLFELGILPAIDVGMSVSRVGGKAQLKAFQEFSGPLKLAYSQFEEMETFARFGTHLDESAKKTLEHGRRIRAILQQPLFEPVPVSEQIATLTTLASGLFDNVPLNQVPQAEKAIRAIKLPPGLLQNISSKEGLSPSESEWIRQKAQEALIPFRV